MAANPKSSAAPSNVELLTSKKRRKKAETKVLYDPQSRKLHNFIIDIILTTMKF